jgi:hypothetical protein
MLKRCSKCKQEKSFSSFNKKKGGKFGLYCHCRECVKEIKSSKEYKEKVNKLSREKPSNSVRKIREARRSKDYRSTKKGAEATLRYNIKKYGITVEKYNELFTAQNGNCYLCGRNQSEFKFRLAVDHCHKTSKVRALLCSGCNTGLGNFKENIEVMKKAIQYIETRK